MTLLRAPANIGSKDFALAQHHTAEQLAQNWSDYLVRNLEGFDTQGHHQKGALEKSPNYYDPRTTQADATAPVPWNGFPRALDRWHKVLGDPTPAKQAQAEATAETVVEYLYWWEPDGQGKASLGEIPSHLVSLLPANIARLARRARLGSGTGAEVRMCYRQQDEYCEWLADRDDQGRIVRLSFTAEPPEYWTELARLEPDVVFQLYKDLVGDHVDRADIFYPDKVVIYGEDANGDPKWLGLYAKGEYNRFNKWNSTHGAVHLTHPANTLGAEIDLAARAANVCQADIDGPRSDLDDDAALTRIACAGYGGINRSSDPTIGEQVGLQIGGGNRVSLTDPIGLYIASIDLSTLERQTAQGRVQVAEADVLTISRGGEDDAAHPRKLHMKLEAPAGSGWVLGDCLIDNRPLEWAGQIARKITMSLYADVKNGGVDATAHGCEPDLVCRDPDSRGFFGTFDPTTTATCAAATADDWLQLTPHVVTPTQLAEHLKNFAAKIDLHLEGLLGDGAEDAPVGDELIAPLPIPSSRAKFK